MKLLYKCPLALMLVAFVVAGFLVSCSHSQQYGRIISDAERIAEEYPDSALALLAVVDPAELTVDSVKAKYYYVMAFAHDSQSRIALSDSLISFSNDYYRGKDLKRSILSATLLASYKFRNGERAAALSMLDSLLSLKNVPDSLQIEPLSKQVQLTAYSNDNEMHIRRLMAIDTRPNRQSQYKFWLYFALLFNGKSDKALDVMNDLINSTTAEDESEQRFIYEYEKLDVLIELRKFEESVHRADSLINACTDESSIPYILLWKSLAKLNMHDFTGSAAELDKADSLALNIPMDERNYFSSFALIIRTVLDYQSTGRVSFLPFAKIYNSQRDNLFDTQYLQQEAIRRTLEIENQRLILEAKSDRQTALLIIVVLSALIVSGALIWYALNKKRKALEVLERNEILQKLVDESKSTLAGTSANEILRRAMLQQLGIIKMVAETPTEQNRDMLRRISSVENGTDKSLVNWESVHEIIDNLYSGFYTRMHNRHGSVLAEKEEQIIALMAAGFSTKEISVITGQTAATIYVRKSSVRKKLGGPEKEDIVAFLRQETED
ncbi:MAG: LuxR C-terminal-related transcriptional regulator [Duncaniella sp.]|nr:LuxR C-terminal-related transcriptional regulator [Duncaniella sp.]